MSETAQTADHVIVVGQGRVLRDEPVEKFSTEASEAVVRVRSPQADRLAAILQADGTTFHVGSAGPLEVGGLISDEVGTVAASHGSTLFELATLLRREAQAPAILATSWVRPVSSSLR